MHFVENHHLAGKTELSDEEMLGRYDAEECLVDGADAERGQQGPL